MGLFSTLASTTVDQLGADATSETASSSSSATLPTVIQLYANKPILLEDTPHVTGYTTMTYQAVQVGAMTEELKNRHHNPDLGVWNCHVKSGSTTNAADNPSPLVHSLLQKISPQASTYCMTVDLSEETQVEPHLSLLQSTLVRHLIDHPPSNQTANENSDPAASPSKAKNRTATATTNNTSLYDLQAVQFGLAPEDKATEQTIDEDAKNVKISLMICALLPKEDDEVSESAYKQKQARALIIYHLRKFAHAVNASLCFVQDKSNDKASADQSLVPAESTEEGVDAGGASSSEDAQPAVSYDALSQLWRDLAMGTPVWEQQQQEVSSTPSTEDSAAVTAATTTALYGPGHQQEDLIETVLLRNANYPGHWKASKDSLWAALPAPQEVVSKEKQTQSGDAGWLTQLRDSIASALPPEKTAAAAGDEGKEDKKPKEKDAAVSSFFESLLKDS